MRNVTAQLFEYLLAAKNSNLPTNHNLNKYSTFWFLDEILSSKGTRLVDNSKDGSSYIEIYRPVLNTEEIEISAMLEAVFKLLQYNYQTDEELHLKADELEEILSLEFNALEQKISSKDKEIVILNDWQQLLLGHNEPKVQADFAITKFYQRRNIVANLISEYKDFKLHSDKYNFEKNQIINAQEIYDYVINSNLVSKTEQQLYLGIGILYIPSYPSIYHPLLTLKINLELNHEENVCRLNLENAPFKIDPILDHVLFYDFEAVEEIRKRVQQNKFTIFDDEIIADILKKIIARVHPKGRYSASPVDVASAGDNIPLLLHRSVLFLKQDQVDQLTQRLESTVNNLQTYFVPSDVLSSIVDPNYASNQNQTSDFLIENYEQSLFPVSPIDPASSTELEQNVLQLLNKNSAVAIFEENNTNKFPIISNLIMYFMGCGKKLLIVAEKENELDEVRKLLPSYLEGLHTMISDDEYHINLIKESLYKLSEGIEKYKDLPNDTSQIIENIEKAKTKSDEVKKQIVDYRELSSKKIFWKEKRYFPYELAQIISKLGGLEHLSGDVIPINAKFEMKNSEIQKLWELKSYFTPENMDLLNYDFIDIDELKNYQGYQKLLETQELYLRLRDERKDLENMFDEETDTRFVQYLYDQLPRLIKDVDEISDPYGQKILQEAMMSLDSYHSLVAAVDRINRTIEDIPHLDTKDRHIALIEKLNHLFSIDPSESPNIFNLSNDGESLYEFYSNKKRSMIKALRVAHLIWIFNEGALALSKKFKGISAGGISGMNMLHHAAALHLSKVEVDIGWSRVRSHFIRVYQPIIQQEHIHPVCLDLYETLKHNSFNDFQAVLNELSDKILIRHKFITFGNFIAEIGKLLPNFTTKLMADIDTEQDTAPDFQAAFEQGKLSMLFEQLKRYESEILEQKHEQLEAYKLDLQHEFIEKECWKNRNSYNKDNVLELTQSIDDLPLSTNILKRIFASFPAVFLSLNQDAITSKITPNQFDLIIFVDASSSDVYRLLDLMHAQKAILFGNTNEKLPKKNQVSLANLNKLSTKYGQALHNFGQQYLEASLLDLVAHSAAWDARLKISQSSPLRLIKGLLKGFESDGKKGVKKCDNVVEEEIFEAIKKIGYEIRCKVKAGNLLLDFLIEGEANSLAINVVGDTQMQREMIKKQLEQEIILKNQGLNVYTVQAPNYYLNPLQTLLNLCEKLEELNIYPKK